MPTDPVFTLTLNKQTWLVRDAEDYGTDRGRK